MSGQPAQLKPCTLDEKALSTEENSAVKRLVKWLKQGMEYCFKRRLAIKPKDPMIGTAYSKRIFQWQKMPEGYRWF